MQRFLVALSLAVLAASAAHAQEETRPSEYLEAVEEGVTAHRAGRWEEAYSSFSRAHALAPSARTHRALGMTAFELGNYPEAFRSLDAALSDPRRPLSDEQRAQVEELRARAEKLMGPTIPLSVPDEPTSASGVTPTEDPLPPAPPSQESGALPRSPLLGDASREIPTAEPANPGSGSGRFWTWVAAGAAGLSGLTAGALAAAGQAEFQHLKQSCRTGCVRGDPANDPDLSKLRFFERGTNVALVVTGIAAGTAAALFFIEGASTGERHVAASAYPGGLLLSGRL
jgi:tetratricopeptide (TPR) repeat protein